MGCCRRDDGFRFTKLAISPLELLQKPWQGAGADRYVLADPCITLAQCARDNPRSFFGVRLFDPV